jgi:single-strand DNA-binding protein
MAGSINKVILVGNVGSQPEIKGVQASGEELATFSLATSEKWKDRVTGETKEKTEWHRVVVFSPGLVKVIKDYVHKGSKIYIEGRLRTREYQDQAGVKKYTTEVVLTQYSSTLVLLDSKKDAQSSDYESGFSDKMRYDQKKERESDGSAADFNHDKIDDDIPF